MDFLKEEIQKKKKPDRKKALRKRKTATQELTSLTDQIFYTSFIQ